GVVAAPSVAPQGAQSSDGASQRPSRDRSIPRGKPAVGCAQFDRRADRVRDPCCGRQVGWRPRGPPRGRDDGDYVAAPWLGDSRDAGGRFERVTFFFGGKRQPTLLSTADGN